jgi:cell fate regulator YaaT (PSP1 superfamily)
MIGTVMDGINIVGVQFRRAGRIYDFMAGGLNIKVGDDVVVDTERGPSLAKVAQVSYHDPQYLKEKDLKPIIRVASRRDVEETHKLTPEYATDWTRERVEKLGLKMAILQSEVQFGGNKVIIYFSAPGRVDFRELVKELASGLKARVELKQVGARDEAKLVGGIGICGREYCCSSFLRDFVPVSIKMAKNQNLALNPSKVSGGCGRLLCCLTYENDLYTELRRNLPPRGTRVKVLEQGIFGDVLKGDVLNQVILIETDGGKLETVALEDVEIVQRGSSQDDDTEGSEAEVWGEDIDFAALAELEDDRGSGSRSRGSSSGRQHSGGPRQQQQTRPPQGQQDRETQQGQRPPQQQGQGQPQGDGTRRGKRRNRNKNRGPHGGGSSHGGGG